VKEWFVTYVTHHNGCLNNVRFTSRRVQCVHPIRWIENSNGLKSSFEPHDALIAFWPITDMLIERDAR